MFALYQVLHVQPVEQASELFERVVVKVVPVHWGVDRQLAYGTQFFVPQEWVLHLSQHSGSQPYFGMIISRYQITYRRFEFLVKLPYEDVLGQPE